MVCKIISLRIIVFPRILNTSWSSDPDSVSSVDLLPQVGVSFMTMLTPGPIAVKF